MPNFGYHMARSRGRAVRAAYAAALPAIARRRIAPRPVLPFEVFSYSGEEALPEQVASIRSLLRFGGRPLAFTVVSDGSYSAHSIELLRNIDAVIHVAQSSDWKPKEIPRGLQTYLAAHATGKQLALIMSLPAQGPALYVDSDVLFFPGAHELANLAKISHAPALYLADCKMSADERLLRGDTERANPVNTGVLFLRQQLNWSLPLSRFQELDGQPTFFTNQTMTHLAMHANGAAPLDPGKYVLQLDDQFEFRDRYRAGNIVLRHYVNPVRHKFWAAL